MSEPVHEFPPRPTRQPASPPDYHGPQEELFDWQKVRSYLFFCIRSVRRRIGLFLLVWLGLVLLAAAALKVVPKAYQVECRLLAQRNPVLAVRADANQFEPLTRAAAETIVRRENLEALVAQTRLVEEWPKRRAPLLRLKDYVFRRLDRAPSESELRAGLTQLLEKRLNVWTINDGTVVIQLTWPDALMAYRLVDAAQQNFLEKRHVLEVSTIAEQISILERHAANVKNEIDRQSEEIQRLREELAPKSVHTVKRPPAPKPIDPEVLNLRVMLDAKRRAIADLEEFRRRQFLELQSRLSQQREVYSENHPAIVNLQQTLERFKQESPQLVALKQEEAELRRQLAPYPESGAAATPSAIHLASDVFGPIGSGGEEPGLEYPLAQLRYLLAQYAHIRERIDGGRIELDTAQAAFKYRYSMVLPPEIPRGPVKPNVWRVIVAAIVAGLFLAIFAAAAADLRSGVALESWQVEKLLRARNKVFKVRFP